MSKFLNWWKSEQRYVTLAKSLVLGLLPVLCCLVTCAAQGRSLGEVSLANSEWNDELFYFKQVEGIVNFRFPQGFFGFNESHALKLSFAAWSPVLVWPWILWGLVFGWNLMSPIICNILLLSLACVLFVWLAKPTWKQTGIIGLLFCLFTLFVRYMLSGMPEVICFSMLIVFYGLGISYLREERTWKLVGLFLMGVVMTLMRPYLVLFLLLPCFFLWRRKGWKGALGAIAILGASLGVYALIKHYLGAEYFAPLFFTDWAEAFFTDGFFAGVHATLSKLYYMGRGFFQNTIQGFRTGLATGAFFGGYLVMMAILIYQSVVDARKLLRLNAMRLVEEGPHSDKDVPVAKGQEDDSDAGMQDGVQERAESLRSHLIIEAHLAFCFVAMLFALLLMYKLTEGSKHLLTFLAAGVFVVGMMETKFYKKAVILGVTFAYLYSYLAVEPYDYQVPFATPEREEALMEWEAIFDESLVLEEASVPSFENSVIWAFNDTVDGESVNTDWQMLYALPEGFGISCCKKAYLMEHLDSLQSRYIFTIAGGEMDDALLAAGYTELARVNGSVLYER